MSMAEELLGSADTTEEARARNELDTPLVFVSFVARAMLGELTPAHIKKVLERVNFGRELPITMENIYDSACFDEKITRKGTINPEIRPAILQAKEKVWGCLSPKTKLKILLGGTKELYR